jgi:hypothetical protein
MARIVDRKVSPSSKHGLAQSDRETCIAVTAYYLAERRNFAKGFELNDWLAAELSVDAPTLAALR